MHNLEVGDTVLVIKGAYTGRLGKVVGPVKPITSFFGIVRIAVGKDDQPRVTDNLIKVPPNATEDQLKALVNLLK